MPMMDGIETLKALKAPAGLDIHAITSEEIADAQDRYLHLAADYRQALDDRKSVISGSVTGSRSSGKATGRSRES